MSKLQSPKTVVRALVAHPHLVLMVDKLLVKAPKITQSRLESMGLGWYYGGDQWKYIAEEMVLIQEDQSKAYEQAARDCLEMIGQAVGHVIQHEKYEELGLPDRVKSLVEFSWNEPGQLHFYGRLDFAGGLTEGHPIQLLEYNGDTCTMLPESSAIQWEQLMSGALASSGYSQFNTIFQDIVERFKELIEANSHLDRTLLLSHLGHEEDRLNIEFLYAAALEAGFEDVKICRLDEVDFSAEEGIFLEVDGAYYPFGFWYKMLPWEYTLQEEPELFDLLESIVMNRLAVVLNPPYSILYQSKGLLKILHELFPESPYLLKSSTDSKDFMGEAFVEKPFFGIEGENIKIFNAQNKVMESSEGDFAENPMLYQSFVSLDKDSEERIYQAGVFHASDVSGLSFRRIDGLIIDEDAEFVGHIIHP